MARIVWRWKIVLLITLVLPLFVSVPLSPRVSASAPSFTFSVAGDYGRITPGTPGTRGYQVISAIAERDPNFHLALGDFGYNRQNPVQWCSNFTAVYPNLVLITGNHDTDNRNGATVTYDDGSTGIPSDTLTDEAGEGFLDTTGPSEDRIGYVSACTPVPAGINWVGSEISQGGASCRTDLTSPSCYAREYYFDYPASNPMMRFIMISAGITGSWTGSAGYASHTCPDSPLTHYCWLSARIDEAKNAGLWVAVALHKNCISDGTSHVNCTSTFDPFNLAITKKVDLWLNAHDHTYQRSFQLKGPCYGSGFTFTSCLIANGGSGFPAPYLRGDGTVVNIVGTGGEGNTVICDSSASTCPNQDYFARLCGSNRALPTVPSTSGCNNDYGFLFFTVNSESISAEWVDVSPNATFSDRYSIQIPPPDFTVSADPKSLTVLVDSSGLSTITVTSQNGFASTVDLAASTSPPTGLHCSMNPTSVTLTSGEAASSTLTCSASSQESYTVIVTGTSNPISHPTTLVVNVAPAPDFAISNSGSISFQAGSSGTTTIALSALNGFSSTVELVVSSTPSGLTCSLDKNSIDGSGSATLTCLGQAGTYTVTITASSGSTTRSTQTTVTVNTVTTPAQPPGQQVPLLYVGIGIVAAIIVVAAAVTLLLRRKPEGT